MLIDFQGHCYSTVRACDLKRDGMGLELSCDTRLVAEIFYLDATGEFTISLFEQSVPLPIIEQFIAEARIELVPVSQS